MDADMWTVTSIEIDNCTCMSGGETESSIHTECSFLVTIGAIHRKGVNTW